MAPTAIITDTAAGRGRQRNEPTDQGHPRIHGRGDPTDTRGYGLARLAREAVGRADLEA